MSSQGGAVSKYLIILNLLRSVDANLNVASTVCADGYDINLKAVQFACDDGCKFGDASTVSSTMSYYNITSTNLYVDARYKFEAWANDTFKQLSGGSNIMDKIKFTEYLSICGGDDDDGCSSDGGSFDLSHSYTIPSTGNMDSFFEGYNVTSRLQFYSADSYNMLGQCEVMYTTKSLYSNKKSYDDDTDDEYYVINDDASVYQYVSSQSSWYMRSFIYATAAFLGVYAGTQIYAKSGLCRSIEIEEDDRREKLMSNSVSMSCNSDDVERLQQDIQSRIHIFKEKIPWPQVDSVKLVHEESIPWPEDSASEMGSYNAPSKTSPAASASTRNSSLKKSPKKSTKKTSPKASPVEEGENEITESKSSTTESSSKESAHNTPEDSETHISTKSSGSRFKLFKKK